MNVCAAPVFPNRQQNKMSNSVERMKVGSVTNL
jgi:hypothetical protein